MGNSQQRRPGRCSCRQYPAKEPWEIQLWETNRQRRPGRFGHGEQLTEALREIQPWKVADRGALGDSTVEKIALGRFSCREFRQRRPGRFNCWRIANRGALRDSVVELAKAPCEIQPRGIASRGAPGASAVGSGWRSHPGRFSGQK